MSAYDVYQIFLANTTMLRMAPQGRRVRGRMEIKGWRKTGLVGDDSANKRTQKFSRFKDQQTDRNDQWKYE